MTIKLNSKLKQLKFTQIQNYKTDANNVFLQLKNKKLYFYYT